LSVINYLATKTIVRWEQNWRDIYPPFIHRFRHHTYVKPTNHFVLFAMNNKRGCAYVMAAQSALPTYDIKFTVGNPCVRLSWPQTMYRGCYPCSCSARFAWFCWECGWMYDAEMYIICF